MSKQQIVFATNNPHKIAEVRRILGDHYDFLSLQDIDCNEELPETTGTIPGNAAQKARYVWENYRMDCFSEDSGLEIAALDGRPGVDTAHYSGSRDPDANMDKVLAELADTADRRAQFRAVIALVLGGELHTFEGTCPGHITTAKHGTGGFGYDPIFIPEGEDRTFAQMDAAEKGPISHRGRAVRQLTAFLTDRAAKKK
jgi:XTP/dITP diphosphohydrolase